MKKLLNTIPFSVLDLATVVEGKTPADTFKNSLDLARHVEAWGYNRYWLAEHHNMISVASSATSVVIGHIAAGTSTIRVGSGGIMLPNHSPLVIAEQFGTLESLFPGRIDLGLGRAPGTDQLTAMAIRGERFNAANSFPQDVLKLQAYFSAENNKNSVRAIPGEGLDIPIWILGSSTDSAHLAAALGLPYAFASHFAPAQFITAINIYRQNFKPSAQLKEPYVLACVNVVAADSDAEANRLVTSLYQLFMGIVTGKRRLLQPPVDNMDDVWDVYEEEQANQMLACTFVGSKETVKQDLQQFLDQTGVNEIMATSHIFEHSARLRSYELLAQVFKD
ncbi:MULTISPECIES: LLM class flavin-dependent oxidoreductase [Pedobacter]|uniref:Luciferase-like monooxygenase n=1 Tax=Pedobacter heparinus (strain ATCC 13125 / DSM 2366 / CIP 104194 / JCM 7457 / NBRC 12017 / NCIMB 9290 / NRRL B-14731 / HIM 762-3) TaxID=485917 RepID=C6XYU0_PEDHD|nr:MULTISPECIES: LLM class flavin-dependent oxidoreductase [Pedobacter]ACU04572.1 Luciferase-like monooxygenase [Pedobacter heparinus DSM 2366]MBB5437578.1 luciferase family oxidoreductase group 1 [Pedobacter sp. AK017]